MIIKTKYKRNGLNASGDPVGDFFIYLVLFLLVFFTIYPFWHVLMYSLSDSKASMSGGLFFIPRKFSLDGYKIIFKTKQIFVAYRNTVLKTVIGTVLSLIISSLPAYPLSLSRIKGRNFFSGMIFFTMLFSGGMIPTYLVIKDLHLLDTFWVYVIPGMMSAYNMFILRNYFASIPSALEESAMIDGANPFQILFVIILPLSKPALAAIAMFYGVGNWNSYMDGILYVNKQSLQLLQVCLRAMINVTGVTNAIAPVGTALSDVAAVTDETMKMVVMVMSIIPVLFAYPFLQKYYTKGVMIGSVKE
jgi:putative aldouronate transport system permease protein